MRAKLGDPTVEIVDSLVSVEPHARYCGGFIGGQLIGEIVDRLDGGISPFVDTVDKLGKQLVLMLAVSLAALALRAYQVAARSATDTDPGCCNGGML